MSELILNNYITNNYITIKFSCRKIVYNYCSSVASSHPNTRFLTVDMDISESNNKIQTQSARTRFIIQFLKLKTMFK
ncbi:unnamed protein product, partial [Larinioides sclopetarius]